MKIEKNKIVFGSILVIMLIFVVAYSILALGTAEEPMKELKYPMVPKLEEEQKAYETKLDAVNAMEENRESNAPSIYNERFLDSAGYYNRSLEEIIRREIVDSIYNYGEINYSKGTLREMKNPVIDETQTSDSVTAVVETIKPIPRNFSVAHQEFFNIGLTSTVQKQNIDSVFYAAVNGNQKVRANDRLELRLLQNTLIKGTIIKKNTLFYGFVSFGPNRVLIEINNIGGQKVALTAHDFQDGNEGIYIENSFRAKATKKVVGDIVEDIRIPGIPQISGIKNLFRRSNRNTKARILNNYRLILKPKK